ncbi:TPA: peptidase domain-containing ABC transporter [Vibrio parahaemolyticus]|nr:peptidase domain-containing ABC transporter [Vibrio parahaemolyticus]
MKVIYQSEITECGLACAAMVASHFSKEVSVLSLREKGFASNKGHNLVHIKKVLSYLGIESRALRINPEKLEQLKTPSILHWNGNHFVVCEKVSANTVTILDPSRGRRKILKSDLGKHFSGVAMEVHDSHASIEDNLNKKSSLFDVLRAPNYCRMSIIKAILMTILLQLYLMGMPYYTKLSIDHVVKESGIEVYHLLFVIFMGLLIIQAVTNYVRDYMVIKLSSEVAQNTYFSLFSHMICLPLSFFSRRSTGDLVSRFNSVDAIRELLSKGAIEAFLDGAIAIGAVLIIAYFSPALALLTMITLIVALVSNDYFSKKQREHSESSVYAEAIERTYFTESVGNVASIKVFGNEDNIRERWYSLFINKLRESDQAKLVGLNRDTAKTLIFGFDILLSIYFIALQSNSETSIGTVVAIIFLKLQLIQRLDKLMINISQFYLLALHSDRIGDVICTDSERMKVSNNDFEIGDIRVKGISHRYSQFDAPTFSDLSIDIAQGESLALIGPSGSGKTTLLKCLMGLEKTENGEILSGDKPISENSNYRSGITSVFQDDRLIAGTIFDNIHFYQGKRDIRLVRKCAEIASIDSDIMSMPMNYETLVSDLGSNLSGGQIQRILIARALYGQPSILFMDEATSNLDHETELKVINNIKELNITRIFTAHRKSTIESADRVIDISNL